MKRYTTVGVLLIIAIAIVVGYLRLATHQDNKRPLYDALPSNSAIIFSFPNALRTFSHIDTQSYANEVYGLSVISNMKHKLDMVDSLLSGVGYTLSGTPMLASVHATSKKDADILYLIELAPSQSERFFSDLQAGGIKMKQRSFRQLAIYDVTSNIAAPLTLAYNEGVLIASAAPFLVEEALLQMIERPSILTDPNLSRIVNMVSEDVDVSVIVSPGNLHVLDELMWASNAAFKDDLHQWADRIALDVTFRDNDLVLTGYATSTDTSYLALHQQPATYVFDADKVMPGNTAHFIYSTFSGLNDTGEDDPLDLDNYLKELLNGEIVTGVMESLDDELDNDRFHLLKLTDVDRTEQGLAELQRLLGNDESGDIAQLKCGNAFDALFSEQVNIANDPFYAIVGEYLLIAESEAIIERFIKNTQQRTLYQSLVYQQFHQHITSTSNVSVYVAPNLLREILPILLTEELANDAAEHWSAVKNVQGGIMQFTSYEGMFFVNGYVQFKQDGGAPIVIENAGDGKSIWRGKLDSTINSRPWFVEDLTEKNDHDVVIQDVTGRLYYMDKSGKLLWSKDLNEPIIGDIHQVDLYKNGKLQLVFNTATQIHLIDRLGNNVEQFPISLPAKAANGMLVVDYDNRRNYRYFVACENYKIFGYYANGKPLPGWSPKARVGTIPFPMQHLLTDGKDYLIATNIDGTLLYFDRKADRRARPIRLKTGFDQPFALHATDKGFTMTNVSRDRKLYTVDEAGEAIEQDLGNLPEPFTSAVLNNEGKSIIALVQKNMVTLIDDTLGVLKQQEVSNIDRPARVVKWPTGEEYLCLVSAADNKIYLYNADMELYPGFPLDGSTTIDVVAGLFGDKDEYTIIYGDKDNFINAVRMR